MNIAIALPEIFLTIAICLSLLIEPFLPTDKRRLISYLLIQTCLIITTLLVINTFPADKAWGLNNLYVRDDLGSLLKISILLVTMLAFVYARQYLQEKGLWKNEFFILILFSVLGMLVIASANHLLLIYLGLELLALALYALVAFSRDDSRATEAAMKYFVLGAIASGMLLYGISILYGITRGQLELSAIASYLSTQEVLNNIPLLFALVFIVGGIAFKFGTVPFHMWAPDVYQGAPTAVTLFLASVPKLAAFAMLMRVLGESLGAAQSGWSQLLLVMGLLSVTVGNLLAIAQFNLKRMFAYSTIAHMGFVLLAAMTGTLEGYSAGLFYTIIYALTSVGSFAILILLSHQGLDAETLNDLKGLNERHPWYAFLMLLLLFSMAGIPPMVGFYAKFSVIQAMLNTGYLWPAVFVVLMSVVGEFYYLRAIKMMYFDQPEKHPPQITYPMDFQIALTANGLLVLFLGLLPTGLIELCTQALVASLP
ncbi:NADH dehydrogenase subunit N [Thiothrix eikelboomii]|uniref:NADH-quinone oxidoreductase subunit N n=1 Tax=Thiothrix eikelboomii TaxID=92487 RepID=A0A1T4W4I9_9GAMM|nr:NADH-quinone oxidoreductase subunit NuoN [Thiothrix eikelboomii]SKA71968.1 NADH dehydrogenase subunit N [Thiothrix eikelboomii]